MQTADHSRWFRRRIISARLVACPNDSVVIGEIFVRVFRRAGVVGEKEAKHGCQSQTYRSNGCIQRVDEGAAATVLCSAG